MFRCSPHQFTQIEQAAQERFLGRHVDHLAASGPSTPASDPRPLARRAVSFAAEQGLVGEHEIVALAEVMQALKRGILHASSLAWVRDIKDARPFKARRLRECLAIERRLAPQQGSNRIEWRAD